MVSISSIKRNNIQQEIWLKGDFKKGKRIRATWEVSDLLDLSNEFKLPGLNALKS